MSGRRLIVVLYGRVIGAVERNGGTMSFTYDEEYRASPAATPLSLSMPIAGSRYTNRIVEAYLRGLLPDNDDVRRRWASEFGIRDRDTFGLIAAIGRDAAGAAQFIPEDDYPQALTQGSVEPISTKVIAARLRRLREDGASGTRRAIIGRLPVPRASSPCAHLIPGAEAGELLTAQSPQHTSLNPVLVRSRIKP